MCCRSASRAPRRGKARGAAALTDHKFRGPSSVCCAALASPVILALSLRRQRSASETILFTTQCPEDETLALTVSSSSDPPSTSLSLAANQFAFLFISRAVSAPRSGRRGGTVTKSSVSTTACPTGFSGRRKTVASSSIRKIAPKICWGRHSAWGLGCCWASILSMPGETAAAFTRPRSCGRAQNPSTSRSCYCCAAATGDTGPRSSPKVSGCSIPGRHCGHRNVGFMRS
jgi:hypothetical protein